MEKKFLRNCSSAKASPDGGLEGISRGRELSVNRILTKHAKRKERSLEKYAVSHGLGQRVETRDAVGQN